MFHSAGAGSHSANEKWEKCGSLDILFPPAV